MAVGKEGSNILFVHLCDVFLAEAQGSVCECFRTLEPTLASVLILSMCLYMSQFSVKSGPE